MQELDVTLVEWPEGRTRGGPRLLGTTTDPSVVAFVRSHLAAEARRELAALEARVRLVPADEGEADG